MPQRSIRKALLAFAIGIVGLLLIAGVSYLGGGRSGGGGQREIEVTPDQLPDAVDPDEAAMQPGSPITGAEGVWAVVTDPETLEVLWQYRFGRLTQREQDVADLNDPEIIRHLKAHRIVRMRARYGSITAPDGRPESGEFHEDLVISIFEGPPGAPVDVSPTSPHLVAQINLDDAEFDAGLNQVESRGPVRMRTATSNVEFIGRGLILQFNDLKSRLEYLEITEVESLRFTMPTDDRTMVTIDADPVAATPDEPPDRAAPTLEETIQYYTAEFERDVKVTSSEGTIDAEKMFATFAFSPGDEPGEFGPSESEPSGDRGDATRQTPGLAPLDENAEHIVLTAQGRMTIVPIDTRPAAMEDDDEMLVEFVGTPVTMNRAAAGLPEQIECDGIEYHHRGGDESGRIDLVGSAAYPLRITSPAMGEVTAQRLRAWPGRNLVELVGPGMLRERIDPDLPRRARGMTLNFQTLAELEFVEHDDSTEISVARFAGDVVADDPRLNVTGSQLNVYWEPSVVSGELKPARIEASNAHVITEKQGRISGTELIVELTEDASGDPAPRRIVGRGDIIVEDPGQQLAAQKLDVAVEAKSSSTRTASDISSELRITSLLADGNVVVNMKRSGLRIEADRVQSTNDMGELTLFGVPVRISDEGSELLVQDLKLSGLDDTASGYRADSEGDGQLTYVEPAQDDGPGRRVNVKWFDGMRMAPATEGGAEPSDPPTIVPGRTRFTVTGDVIAKVADLDREDNQFKANQMSIDVADVADEADRGSARDADPSLVAASLNRHKTVERIELHGDVSLLARRYADATRQKIERRMWLTEAQHFAFNQVTEHAIVHGSGKLLIEDYRPHAADRPTEGTPITGRGVSLFVWTERMELDGQKAQVSFHGNAQLIYEPEGAQRGRLEMGAGHLVADMQGIGGIHVMHGSEIETLRIDRVHAYGGVVIRDFESGWEVEAEEVIYDATRQKALLLSAPGRKVLVKRDGQAIPLGNRSVLWDIEKDEFRGSNLTGGF